MCQYYSFCVDVLDPRIVYVADGYSHSEVELLFGVKPDSYRECEWTDESPETLVVRGLTANESMILRETILARWATRRALVSFVAPASAAYDKAVATASAAYDKAVAPARAAYNKAVAPASAAYRAHFTKEATA